MVQFSILMILYDKKRLNEPRFLVSYKTLASFPKCFSELDFDTSMKNVAFTYDNVITLLSYLAYGGKDNLMRAKILADAFVYAQRNDRFYNDGRLRNAYQGEDLTVPAGWIVNNRDGTVRLPGWWDICEKKWFEDAYQVGTDTGNMVWIIIGLLRAYKILGKEEYLKAAKVLGNWIEENT